MRVTFLILAVPKTPKIRQKCSHILLFCFNNISDVFGLKLCAGISTRYLHSSIITSFILGVAKMKYFDYKTFRLSLVKNKELKTILWKKQAIRSLFVVDLEIEPDKGNFRKTIKFDRRPEI
jgi:hypothetical protein